MRQKKEAHAFAHVPASQLRTDSLGDVMQPFAAGGDFERGFVPVHGEIIAV